MADVNSNSSLITLNVNDLNTPIKRQRLAKRMKRDSPAISYLKWTYVRFKDTNSLKDTKNIYQESNKLQR